MPAVASKNLEAESNLPRSMRETATQIVTRATGMSSRPEFYSGRGARTSDLNSDGLDRIHERIKTNVGMAAAKQFVAMVMDLPELSATQFLLSLYRLEGADWKWSSRLRGRENGVYATEEGTAMATVIEGFHRRTGEHETETIRRQFLGNHTETVAKIQHETGQTRHYAIHASASDFSEASAFEGSRTRSANRLINDDLDLSKEGLRKALTRFAEIDPSYGKAGQGLESAIEAAKQDVRENVADALGVVMHAYKRAKHYKAPSLATAALKNPKEALCAALAVLETVYQRSAWIVGRGPAELTKKRVTEDYFGGRFAPTPLIPFSTPLGVTERRADSSRFEPVEGGFGELRVEQPGFKIGERVKFRSSGDLPKGDYVVVNATNYHNALGEGTATIKVKNVETGEIALSVPWVLEKIETKKKNK